jgi:hypothetical protein
MTDKLTQMFGNPYEHWCPLCAEVRVESPDRLCLTCWQEEQLEEEVDK